MKTAAGIVIYLVFNICALTVKAQTISSFTPQKGAVGSLVKITGTSLNNPTSVIIGGVSAIVISNNGATLVAMVMPGAVSGKISLTITSKSVVSTNNFVVASADIPTVQQGIKLLGTGVIGFSNQGNAVALSADGNTAVVGGFTDNEYQGAVWIFTRTNGDWKQQGKKLIGTDTVWKPQQGYSLAVSADGNTVIVGGITDNTFQGAAWIFTRDNIGNWRQQGNKLIGSGNVGTAQQGSSVGISADGNTAIIGGMGDNNFKGAAWLFRRTNGVWKQYGNKLVGTGAIGNAQQGYAVTISADGKTAAVGGNTDNSERGAIWIYTLTDSIWSQQGNKLSGTGSIDTAQQGSSLSFNANGNTIIVAGGKDNKGKGAAWIFTRNGNQWVQQGSKLVSNDTNRDTARLKFSVALNADGNIALIGGTNNDGSKGAALLFTRDGDKWTQNNNQFVGVGNIPTTSNGLAVGMSADASTIILGSIADGVGPASIFVKLPVPTISNLTPTKGTIGTLVKISGTNFKNLITVGIGGVSALIISSTDTNLVVMVMPGANTAEVNITTAIGTVTADNFSVIPTSYPTLQQGEKINGVTVNAQYGYSVAISADGNTAVVGSKANVFIYKRTNSVWGQEGNQLFSINSNNSQQAYSVAINADGNTAIVGSYIDNANQGAAWVFNKTNGVWSQQGNKLVGTGSRGAAQQGYSVAISADGNTAVIGGKQNNGGEGSLWVFKRNINVWTEESSLFPVGAIGLPQLGYSIAISADGNTIVSGGNQDNKGKGAAWVFVKIDNRWLQRGPKFNASDAISISNFGSSVTINADGNRIVVGGNKTEVGGAGAIVFEKDINNSFTLLTPLIGITASNDIQLGKSVTMSADGNTILVSAPLANNKGAIYTFTKSINGEWKEQSTILTGKNAIGNSLFGSSIALSADASTAFIGGPGDNTIGATWAFRVASTNTNLNTLTISAGTLSPIFSSETLTYSTSVSKTTDSIALTATAADSAAVIEVKINGSAKSIVKSGFLSNKMPLNFGKNSIEIIITSEDQQTVKTHLITVIRFNQTVNAFGTLNTFVSCVGSTSSVQNIKVSGSGLSDNIVVAAPAGFEISTRIDSGYTNSFTLSQTEGIVDTTIIYTRMITSKAETITDSIVVSSPDAISKKVPVSRIVNELPIVSPIIGANQVCINNLTKFSNGVVGGIWSSGKDSIATINTEGLITPLKVGTAPILYSVSNANGCKTIVKRNIVVDSLPKVNAITGNEQTCKDGSTTFSTTTSGGVWSSNNTSIASIIDAGVAAQVNGITTGTTTISYTVVNSKSCETKVVKNVTVYSKPIVSPIIGASSVCTGTTLLLSNTTTGGIWSVDSFDIATINNIGVLLPIKQGKVNASYTVNSTGGCFSLVNKLITINKTPEKPAITLDANQNLVSSIDTGSIWYKSSIDNNPTLYSNPVEVAKGKIFNPLLNGRYQVRINNTGCLSDFSNVFVYITTPITMLYPNPVNSFVIAQIESENLKRIILQLVDNSGNVIESKPTLLNIGKNEIRFNTERLVKGSYFIAIKNYPSSSKMFVK